MKKYGYVSMFAALLLVGFEVSAISKTITIKLDPKMSKTLKKDASSLMIAVPGAYAQPTSATKIILNSPMTLTCPAQGQPAGNNLGFYAGTMQMGYFDCSKLINRATYILGFDSSIPAYTLTQA